MKKVKPQESIVVDEQETTSSEPPVTSPIEPEKPTTPKRKIKITSYIVPFVILVGLVASLGIITNSLRKPQETRSRATNNGPKLSIEPAAKNAKVGDTFTLGVALNTQGDTVSAVELHLTYDKSAIQVTGFTPGTALPVVLTPATFTDGTIDVTLGAQPTSPFKGADVIGTITAKLLAAKQSSLTFADTTAVAAIGKTSNSLSGKTGGSISNTQGGGNITPTPTPTPTPKSAAPSTSQSSFGALTANQPITTTQPPTNTTNYTPTNQNNPPLPPPVTSEAPITAPPRSTNIFVTIVSFITNLFQTIFSKTGK